jgi:hypothetical protein
MSYNLLKTVSGFEEEVGEQIQICGTLLDYH